MYSHSESGKNAFYSFSSNITLRRIKLAVLVVLVAFLVSLIGGCTYHQDFGRQLEYHDEIEELEIYVLGDMGDYICFCEPRIDDSKVTIEIILTSDYTYNEDTQKSYPVLAVMEDTRTRINAFLVDHQFYFGDADSISFIVEIPPDRSPMSDGTFRIIGKWCNQIEAEEVSLNTVNYYYGLHNSDISLLNRDGIRKIYLDSYTTEQIEELYEIIDYLPELQEVVVDNSVVHEVESRYPDIVVIGIDHNPSAI